MVGGFAESVTNGTELGQTVLKTDVSCSQVASLLLVGKIVSWLGVSLNMYANLHISLSNDVRWLMESCVSESCQIRSWEKKAGVNG